MKSTRSLPASRRGTAVLAGALAYLLMLATAPHFAAAAGVAPPAGSPPAGGAHAVAKPKTTPVAKRPHPHRSPLPPAPKRPHPHRTLGPVPPKRAHPHRAPWPITLSINTVPALSGIRFSFDGHVLTTGADGRASYTAEHDFAQHTLILLDPNRSTGSERFAFSRWGGQRDPKEAFAQRVTALPLRSNSTITAAFTTQRQVLPQYIEQNAAPLALSRIGEVSLKADSGAILTIKAGVPVWLNSERPVYQHGIFSVQPAAYSLMGVMVGGTNVVDSGRQSFQPLHSADPTFVTQFHNLVITGHDALFHGAVGSTAVVTFPDGSKHTYRLDAGHSYTLTDLPRGKYVVIVSAGHGIAKSNQFVLSKDRTSDVAVITGRDISVLALLAIVLALGLIAIGRRIGRDWAVRKLRRAFRRDPALDADLEDVFM